MLSAAGPPAGRRRRLIVAAAVVTTAGFTAGGAAAPIATASGVASARVLIDSPSSLAIDLGNGPGGRTPSP